MLSNMLENHEKSSSSAPNGSSVNEDNERDTMPGEALTLSPFRSGSDAVDQDVQPARQGVAMVGQRPNPISQFSARYSGELLNPDNPRRPIVLDRRGEAGQGRITPRLSQRGENARRVDSDQIGLKIHDKLSAVEAIKIELRHPVVASEAAIAHEGQTFFGNLLGIGADCGLVLSSPKAVTLDLRCLDNSRFGKARHVKAKRPCCFSDVGVQRQIDFHAAHINLLKNAYD